ncbi:hypothetical protein EJ05DRAFT_442644 [Pseudovirgaria hyperparasitica]|uniref:Zn(2)-C6 fungal-type domain-containing protein n=1 Tax=Pseudovirgaria hyperparasitica TaxID=470096 RepID=A0A6A6VYI4_9PEZI|nr:uncharacterized protein EJ05DRAFT_442644 [Pseudovirgaria hyperparasitica]KAF2755275.1 hypothetical protein EJ05DRAFT_442644 [Pseudovirgaria hyperparasitica]
MAPKRSQGDESPTSPQKSLKIEHSPDSHPQDSSNSVKKKLSSSTRTGQACDRCKVRKIRCDGRPGACSPCAQNNTPCKTTDRITGRATTRGHTEHLEAENDYLKRIIADLQSQLRDTGADVKPLQPFPAYVEPSAQTQHVSWAHPDRTGNVGDQATRHLTPSYSYEDPSSEGTKTSQPDGLASGGLPTFRTGCYGDNYLGISSTDSVLSPIKGTSLSIFGVELNLTDFVPQDEDEEASPTSYQTFLRVALGRAHVDKLNFPEEKELRQFMTWYFRSLHPYMPVFHKPAIMNLVWKVYNDSSFQPTAAQTAIIHMILAMIKYQISTRNTQPDLLGEAHKHYLFAISHFPDLLLSHTLEDVQALALLSIHMRNLPKPGAAWLVTSIAFTVAIELGLHRSTKSWVESTQMSQQMVELRKRVFWALFALLIGLSGRLGRPMPLRPEDIDVEFPLPLNDTDEGDGKPLEKFSDCSFQIGLRTPGLANVVHKMYSTIYSIRQSPQTYERTVRNIETELAKWRESMPKEFAADVDGGEHYIFARYTLCWEQEVKLLLHHPAVCTSTNPDFAEYNMSACLQAARDLVHVVDELRQYKSLDIPWVNVIVYLAAIFTTLYIYTQHKKTVTSQEVTDLQADMDVWIQVLEAIGEIYGKTNIHFDNLHHLSHTFQVRVIDCLQQFKRSSTLAWLPSVLVLSRHQPMQQSISLLAK